jgi:hypothetical protein
MGCGVGTHLWDETLQRHLIDVLGCPGGLKIDGDDLGICVSPSLRPMRRITFRCPVMGCSEGTHLWDAKMLVTPD